MLDGYSNVGYGMDGSHMPPRNMGMDVGSNMFATQKPYHDNNLPSQGFPASNPVPPAQPAFDCSKPPPNSILPRQTGPLTISRQSVVFLDFL
jgi:hypothetical protein